MAIKIITLDLDGTLMSADHLTVSEANRTAIRQAHEKGVKIAISTGRTIAIMGDVCEQVPEVDYVMYSNGAGVMDRATGKNIYTNFMSWNFCEGVLDYLDTMPAFVEVYVDGKSYVQEDKAEFFIDNILPKEFIDELMGRMIICSDVKSAVYGKDIEKITLYSKFPEAFDKMWNHFSAMRDKIYLASSLPGNMEMTRAGVDKGAALDGMCKVLGITAAESMAFGDAGNDCPMLRYAKYSFAMENGTDECKAAAKYTTKSNALDGVAFAINKYVLNK
ncbi:MAG: Cof-type HAD-IIB family hydrolase [Eubacterium sp.]